MNRHVSLCGKSLTGVRHICAFFDSRDEQYEILNPYFREGLDSGELVITIVETMFHQEHRARMSAGNVPVDRALEAGDLQILSADETYVKDRVFVVDRMYGLLQSVLDDAATKHHRNVRTMGDMEWALRNLPGTDELITYEARVNTLTPRYDCTLLCAYDVNRFSGRVIADVLSTHSHVVLAGRVHENPYFVEPVAFLKKLALRRPTATPLRRN